MKKNLNIIKELEGLSKIRTKIKKKFIKCVKKINKKIQQTKMDEDFYLRSEIYSDCGHTVGINYDGLYFLRAKGEENKIISINDISIEQIVELVKTLPQIFKDLEEKLKERKSEEYKVVEFLNKITKIL